MSNTPEPPLESQQPAFSLDALAEAFAQAMGTAPDSQSAEEEGGDDGLPIAAGEDEEEASQVAAEIDLPEDRDDCCPLSPRALLETMLFVGNRDGQALSPQRAAELMRGVEVGEIAGLVDELNELYQTTGCAYTIANEGAGYRMTLRDGFEVLCDRFYGRVREAKLSRAAVDCLAIVAYQQPISGEQVSRFRGKPSGHVLSQLVHRGLLRLDRSSPKQRTAEYGTTERFLRLFGLESVDELPRD